MALGGETLDETGKGFVLAPAPALGCGRNILHEIVAEAAPGDEGRREATGSRGGGERFGHRPDCRVDGKIGPVASKAAAGRQRIEAANPERLAELGRPGRAIEIDQDRVE